MPNIKLCIHEISGNAAIAKAKQTDRICNSMPHLRRIKSTTTNKLNHSE